MLALFIASSCATVTLSPVTAKKPTTIELTSCALAKHKGAALCGKHQVYENRAAQTGRKIALNIVILAARNSPAKADPVFYLAGGPGQAAAHIASAGEDAIMRELRRERDLVFVDMRGTGDSNGLQCSFPIDRTAVQNFFLELFDPVRIQACRRKLEQSADLRYYTTPLGIEDLEEIRSALGYDKINLYGISYGSIAALEYVRRYSDHVRSAVLAGVAAPTAKLPLQFALAAQQAMTRLFHDCA
ncbi:MAG: alpha/beta fold hydrolase, partial [Candidatus Binatia bacterium]